MWYNYKAGSYTPVVSFDLVVIPKWLVFIPQEGKFKAPQSIIKRCVNTQVNICEEQLGTIDCFLVSYQKLRYKQDITLHLWGIIFTYTLPRLRLGIV